MTLWDMSPWDQLPYFDTFKETSVPFVFGQPWRLCLPNNQRCILIFSATAMQTIYVSTNPLAPATQGLGITTTISGLAVTTRTHGLMPTLAWYSSAQSNITVFEGILQDWPKDGDNPLKNIIHPPYVAPPPQVITAPGVKGDQGIMSYWRSIVDKIRGK